MLPDGMSTLTHLWLFNATAIVAALWLDKWLGEPERYHPLVMFGNFVGRIEKMCRRLPFANQRIQGICAWLLAVVPITLVISFLAYRVTEQFWLAGWCLNTWILYLAVAGRSLVEHAERIYLPLQQGDIEQARRQVAMIVSRNTDKMTEHEITSSAVESVLENGNDAVIGPMVWFAVFGVPGAVLFRLANTLDAMWGYKTEKYRYFGWCSARVDDLLGWLPARITALLYAFQGNFRQAIVCWRRQAAKCSSPNGGVVMTAGAGALGVTIGGPTYYHGVLHHKEPMGRGEKARPDAIISANKMVSEGSRLLSYLWLLSVFIWVF